MPIYFGDVAPNCPISTDESTGPAQRHLFNHPIIQRTTIPPAFDLTSAIRAANQAASIVNSMLSSSIRNNTFQAKGGGHENIGKDKFKNTPARFVEQKNMRVKKPYKYFGYDDDGNKNELMYVVMQRLERMVWYDKARRSHMTWEYGNKGEGEPVSPGGG